MQKYLMYLLIDDNNQKQKSIFCFILKWRVKNFSLHEKLLIYKNFDHMQQSHLRAMAVNMYYMHVHICNNARLV